MLSLWSAKGGSGTTVTACLVAEARARLGPTTLVDLRGDVPCALGADALDLPTRGAAGISDWLAAGASVPGDALDRLAVTVAPRLRVLPCGTASPTAHPPSAAHQPSAAHPTTSERVGVLARLLAAAPGTVVVDAGTDPCPIALALIAASSHSLAVTRPCFVGLRRLQDAAIAPTGVVVVREADRALTDADISDATGAPVVASIPWNPHLARAVDVGLLAARAPRASRRAASAIGSLAGSAR